MVRSTPPKTYFILQSLVYKPDDLIQLGQVIKDPTTPHIRLANPLPLTGALTPRKSSSSNWSLTMNDSDDTSVGAFARLTNIFSTDARAARARAELLERTGAVLETQYFEVSEDPSYLDRTFELPGVKTELGRLRSISEKFFMVTGVKTVRLPGETITQLAHSKTATGKASVTLDPEGLVEGGVEVQTQASKSNRVSETPDSSYVVAYRLRELRLGWRRKRLKLGKEVGGAELSGRRRKRKDGVSATRDDEFDDWEVDGVEIGSNDFGSSMPMVNLKQAVDEEDGSICVVIEAEEQ